MPEAQSLWSAFPPFTVFNTAIHGQENRRTVWSIGLTKSSHSFRVGTRKKEMYIMQEGKSMNVITDISVHSVYSDDRQQRKQVTIFQLGVCPHFSTTAFFVASDSVKRRKFHRKRDTKHEDNAQRHYH